MEQRHQIEVSSGQSLRIIKGKITSALSLNCCFVPVEAVHHLQLSPKVLLGEVVEHAGVHQGLHEVGTVLWQTQAGQPLVTNPLVVHVSICQCLRAQERGLNECF